MGGNKMINLFKKTIGVCLIGFGLGLLFVILLPFTGWLFLIRCSFSMHRNSMAYLLIKDKGECLRMTIVVKKVPKFLRGIVKLIFGIK